MVNEGFPLRVVERLQHRLPHLFAERLNRDVRWEVTAIPVTMPLDEAGTLPMFAIADRHRPDSGSDVVVLVTDLPRRAGTQPIMSDFSTEQGVGLARCLPWTRFASTGAPSI